MAGKRSLRVGVLSLQGASREHIEALKCCGITPIEAKYTRQLYKLDGLILPGGESTAMRRLMSEEMAETIRELAQTEGMGLYGTCAGAVLLAKTIYYSPFPSLGLMDITAWRNSFGRQVASFQTDLNIPVLGEDLFPSVFIRAPIITSVGQGVEILATHNNKTVFVRQDKMLASSFHPELTADPRAHRYFLQMLSE